MGDPKGVTLSHGNVMSNVFGFSYPGPGATLGSGLTFGYRAGRHLTRTRA